MILDLPSDILLQATTSAILNDLSDIEETISNKKNIRRPYNNELRIYMFPQLWGDTATGYIALMAGQALTEAYTIVITVDCDEYCVYFGCGKLAYKKRLSELTRDGKDAFLNDIQYMNMAHQNEAMKRYA